MEDEQAEKYLRLVPVGGTVYVKDRLFLNVKKVMDNTFEMTVELVGGTLHSLPYSQLTHESIEVAQVFGVDDWVSEFKRKQSFFQPKAR